ncbi:GspE/PulE family protein [Limnobacter sp.]|uniref:GspE/PulE family protein n=1 Tax=Limnobacter sp. TaxID=2003368 RepID=UPI00391B3B61
MPNNPFDWKVITAEDLKGYTPDFSRISLHQTRQWSCAVAFPEGGNEAFWVVSAPRKPLLYDWAIIQIPREVMLRPVLAIQEHFDSWLNDHEASLSALPTSQENLELHLNQQTGLNLSIAEISQTENSVVRLVDSTLFDALQASASDVHLETGTSGLAIKYRIDGALCTVLEVESKLIAEQMISRVKVLAELDIGERRVPQDGRFKVNCLGRSIDVRVSIMPSIHGEDSVLRLLDRSTLADSSQQLKLDTLGFDAKTLNELRKLISAPYGMVLVTGPTGSGKTTTLYAALSESRSPEEKVITIEDPVEYKLEGVLQIPVNERKGLTFSKGLRSILRHDPDKIMVGEIRDPDTAQVAVQSALTGHLVFTSVHANNVFDVLGRFLHMGLDPYTFVSAINGVVAQRLIRVLCNNCKVPTRSTATNSDQEFRSMHDQGSEASSHFKAVGCPHCRGTGYKGRRAIAEVLVMNDTLRDKIVSKESIQSIKLYAASHGFIPIAQKATCLFNQGITSAEEVSRVAFSTEQ